MRMSGMPLSLTRRKETRLLPRSPAGSADVRVRGMPHRLSRGHIVRMVPDDGGSDMPRLSWRCLDDRRGQGPVRTGRWSRRGVFRTVVVMRDTARKKKGSDN